MIRPAIAADLDALLDIQRCWPGLPQWTRAHFLQEIGAERCCFVVAEDGGMVRGYAGFWAVVPEAQVTVIAVDPERARRGLGRALLGYLMAAARARGCEKATLEVSADNAAALRLYQGEGFHVVGRRPKFYNDGSDAVLMDRGLS